MIISRTYNGVNGQNYIQDSSLAFATLYVVKREGTQYDKYISGDTNRTYIHDASTGKISFTTTFDSGEKVFVIYKQTTEITTPIPGACTMVLAVSPSPPIGLIGEDYVLSFLLSGSRPIILSNIVKPAWATVAIYGLLTVRITGIPTTETVETVSFDLTNCGGTISKSVNINVIPGTVNFFANDFFTTTISSITGPSFMLTSGYLPSNGHDPIEGIHDAYTGTITVGVTNVVFPRTLTLKINGMVVQSLPVTSDGSYVFTSQSYTQIDEIRIILS